MLVGLLIFAKVWAGVANLRDGAVAGADDLGGEGSGTGIWRQQGLCTRAQPELRVGLMMAAGSL